MTMLPKRKNKRTLTYGQCKLEVSKWNSFTSLNKNDPSIIMKIKKMGWDELLSHWPQPFSSKNPKWTYERCKEEVSKMVYLNELQGTSVINVLRKNGWFDELTSHLIRVQSAPYTEEEVLREALKYKTRNKFRVNSPGQYSAAKRLGIMDKAVKHMGKSNSEKQYTKKEILESASKWKNQRDWIKNEPSIFRSAKSYTKPNKSKEDNEFWEECISHMEYIFKPNGYWTYEKCKPIALSYNDRRIFHKEQKEVYKVIQREGWDDLLEHMIWTTPSGNTRYPKGYFDDKEKAREVALKYNTRSQISEKSPYAYNIIRKNGWDDELFSHMKRHATDKPRQIYVYYWSDNHAYVGQSCDWKKRHWSHLREGCVFNHIQKTGEQPIFKILTKRPVKEENTPKYEDKWMKHYESLGYRMLNSAPAGSLGGKRSVWTKENIWNIVSKCSSMTEFYKATNSNCIQSCHQMGIYDDIVDKLKSETDGKWYIGGWTVEDALEEAKKYTLVSEFQKACSGGFKCLSKNGLLKVAFPKTSNELKEEYYNNKENCKKAALECKTRSEFSKKHNRFYRTACKNDWIDEISQHMVKSLLENKPRKWNYELLKKLAVNYDSISKFEKDYSGGVKFMMKYGYREEFFPTNINHNSNKTPKYWTLEKLKEISLQCKNRSELQKKHSGAYKFSKKYGYIDELFPKTKNKVNHSFW